MPDTMRTEIRMQVQTLIMQTNWNTLPNIPVIGTKVNEARVIDSKETAIIIHTPAGPRWFEVIVKEQY